MPDTTDIIDLAIAGALTTSSVSLGTPVTHNGDITDVIATIGTAPTGADLIFDVLKNGTTIFGVVGTVAVKSPMGTGDLTLYFETTGGAPLDIRQGTVLLVESEQMVVSGQIQGSSKVDGALPVYAVPVTRAQNGTSAATHAAGVNVSLAKPRIAAGASASTDVTNGVLAATPELAYGDVLSVSVTQVGSTVAGSNLNVSVEIAAR